MVLQDNLKDITAASLPKVFDAYHLLQLDDPLTSHIDALLYTMFDFCFERSADEKNDMLVVFGYPP